MTGTVRGALRYCLGFKEGLSYPPSPGLNLCRRSRAGTCDCKKVERPTRYNEALEGTRYECFAALLAIGCERPWHAGSVRTTRSV